MESFATAFAGLGLFFIGLKNLNSGFRQLSGRRLHDLVESATNHPVRTALIGILSGAVTQSANAVTFIIVSMVSSGLVTLQRGITVSVWANIGTSILVLLATLDLHVFVFLLIGTIGMLHYFKIDQKERFKPLINALLGISILMLGLLLIKNGAGGLKDADIFVPMMNLAADNLWLVFVAGVLLSLLTQSFATASAIVVTLVAVGIFNFSQAAMLILGANLGAGISIYLLGKTLTGSAKKIVLFQVWTKLAGVIIMLMIFSLCMLTVPQTITTKTAEPVFLLMVITAAVIVMQILSALLITLVMTPLTRLADKWVMNDPAERLAIPKYIQRLALDEAESALDLVGKEQDRIIKRLPEYLNELRNVSTNVKNISYRQLNEAGISLTKACDDFLLELLARNQQPDTVERIIRAQRKNALLHSVQISLNEFIHALKRHHPNANSHELPFNLSEGLHFILMVFADCRQNPSELDMLVLLTNDRADIMEKNRHNLITTQNNITKPELNSLLAATTQFERLIWLINSYARSSLAAMTAYQGQGTLLSQQEDFIGNF